MLEVKNVDIIVSTRYLIKSLSFTLKKGDKLAIIGEEGNGKTTLLQSLLGICQYAEVKGTINFKGNRAGYLRQTLEEESLNKKVYDFLFEDDADYYSKCNNLYKYLVDLKIEDSLLEQAMYTLSGGEKIKINILKLLLDEYDILFLDEPTNDLDLETLNWLESFINKINKPIIYVSHDEIFLSHTANMILHIEQVKNKTECRHTIMKIDYDSYVEERFRFIKNQTQLAASEKREFEKKEDKLNKIMQKVEYQQKVITRKDPHGAKLLKKKMHTLKSQEKKLEDLKLTEKPEVEESIKFFFKDISVPKKKVILKLDIPELKIKESVLAQNIKIDVIGNVHICIIGKNGAGKTTLLKRMYEELKTRKDIKVGYMPQNYEDILENYEKVLDFISHNKEEMTKARMCLGNMNFTREEMTGNIKDLSNGSKAKLFFIKLVLEECNVLLLDEPTRNVSPLSNPVIRNVLKEFKGTIISVSHDRKYIEDVIDDLYLLSKEGMIKKEKIPQFKNRF